MLTILDRPTSLCDGFSRREAMRIGGLSAIGLSLPQLLQRPAVAGRLAEVSSGFGRAKSAILTGRPFPLSRGQVIREIVG